MNPQPQFNLGDRVTWTSQSAGVTKTKTGTIVMVVGPCAQPRPVPSPFTLRNDGGPRDHTSYLVQVGRSNRLYWPLVKNLQLATEESSNA